MVRSALKFGRVCVVRVLHRPAIVNLVVRVRLLASHDLLSCLSATEERMLWDLPYVIRAQSRIDLNHLVIWSTHDGRTLHATSMVHEDKLGIVADAADSRDIEKTAIRLSASPRHIQRSLASRRSIPCSMPIHAVVTSPSFVLYCLD